MPVINSGQDVLVVAQTGTGKTAAFALPILQRLTQGPLRRVRALVLAPTRELAEQIHQAFSDFGRSTRIKSVAIYGGVSKLPQEMALRRGVEVVVACPGRLLDHMEQGSIDLSHIEVLVLDEADRMCDMGFLPDVRRILKQLPEERQTIFCSATMPDEVRALAGGMLHDPATVQIGAIAPAKTVSHALYPAPERLKSGLLLALLEHTATGRVLVFTRTKHRADRLATMLSRKGYRATALQGNMTQNQRQRAIDGFREGRYDIMVATDVAARGIDVADIAYVINYDMPDTVDAYTHRIGRTGRAAQTGAAFTLTTPADEMLVRGVERALGHRIERRRLPDFAYDLPEASAEAERPARRPFERAGAGNNGRSRDGVRGSAPQNRRGDRRPQQGERRPSAA
jgi:ATP-dependent RNA helicase RhlE